MNREMSLSEKVLFCLEQTHTEVYLINETVTKTEELFFIKKDLSMFRNCDTTKCEVTIYKDYLLGGDKKRGSASFQITPSMSVEEICAKIRSATKSASAVKDSYYPLPEKETYHSAEPSNQNNLSGKDIAEIIFLNDTADDAFINSAEIFITNTQTRIVNSNNSDITYSDTIYSGEFVVQAVEPSDVELYYDFKFSSLDKNIQASLSDLVNESLNTIKNRSMAKSLLCENMNLKYNKIILEGNCIYELFSYFTNRANASMIYPGYSKYKTGDVISDNTLQKINLEMTPKKPFTNEGVRLNNLPVIADNKIVNLFGNSKFSYYIGIPVAGVHSSYRLECGNTPIEEMAKEPHLKIVNFSDFQMEEFTGQFGGEYRLAYYFDGKNTVPVTNGSISFNIKHILSSLVFSSESQTSYDFNGPKAISFDFN